MRPRLLFVFLLALPFLLDAAGTKARTTDDMGPAALSGTVSSTAEGKMEGVLVTAQKDGSNISVTVASDDKGHYAFPASRLAPGHYALRIRAVGYDLDRPDGGVTVAAGRTTAADITLKKTDNLEAQLTNAEWLDSIPGTDDQKRFLDSCTNCHTLQRIMMSKFNAEQFQRIIKLMGTFYQGSVPERPQLRVDGVRARVGNEAAIQKAAAYLASVNLSTGPRKYPLKTMPRPTGRATHVIVTTYQLPRKEAMPHDADIWPNAPNGHVWYSDFGSEYIGELDPATGAVTDYAVPVMRPDEPKGSQDMTLAPNGHIWIHTMSQGGLGEFDPKTKTFTMHKYPKDGVSLGAAEASHMNVDGNVWGKSQRYNAKTGQWEDLGNLLDQNGEPIHPYGTLTDDQNNLYEMDFGGTKIGKIDAKTGKLTTWKTAFEHSRPRRAHWGADGKIWFAEYGADGIGSFDPATGKIMEWRVPVKWALPYDVLRNKKGDIWTGSMFTDRVTRFNPDTGVFVDYLLPDPTCIRHVDYDDVHDAFWTSGVHTGTIVRVETLD